MDLPNSPDVISPAATRTLLALVTVHEAQGHATLTEVGLAAGGKPKNTIFYQVELLRSRGLVESTPGRVATLVPLVRPVSFRAYSP